MRRYAVTIEVEEYAHNREDALHSALGTLRMQELGNSSKRIVSYVQECEDNGKPMLNRKSKRNVLNKGV